MNRSGVVRFAVAVASLAALAGAPGATGATAAVLLLHRTTPARDGNDASVFDLR